MVRDRGYDVMGLLGIMAFAISCLWGIDETWKLRFNGKFYINKKRLMAVLLAVLLALWQLCAAYYELTSHG